MSVIYLMPQLRLERAPTLHRARVELGVPCILGLGSAMRCFVDRSDENGDQVMVELQRLGRRSVFFIKPGQAVRPLPLERGELTFAGIETDRHGRIQAVHIRVIDDSADIYATA